MKSILSTFFIVVLGACAPASTTLLETSIPATSQTSVHVVSPTNKPSSPTLTKTKTGTSTAAAESCMDLLHPENGTEVSPSGQVTFEWQSQRDAQLYILTLTSPTGVRETIETRDEELTHPVKATEKQDHYEWYVSAYNGKNEQMCVSDVFTFAKSVTVSAATATRPRSASTLKSPTPLKQPTSTVIVIPTIPPTRPPPSPTIVVIPPVDFTPTAADPSYP